MVWSDGATFTGLWKDDMRHYGEMRFSNGTIYRGSFKNDKLDGFGQLLMVTGTIFEGEFSKNVCSSVGKLLHEQGDIYYGQHKAFVKEG